MRLFVVAALVGCYHTPASNPSCTLLCAADCPDGMSCVNGFCVAEGEHCEPTFTRVYAGNGFACALDSFNRRWCWGANDQHQLDDTSRTTLVYATPVDAGPWDELTAGGDHMCGLKGGTLSCWGGNDRQQVSGRVSGDVDKPVEIAAPNGKPWSMAIAGYTTTCGIADGRLYCWGANNNGQAGAPGRLDVGVPTQVTTIVDWQLVAVGRDHACAVSASAGLYCWGSNYYGQIGNGGALSLDPPVAPSPVSLPNVTALGIAGTATCAVSDGSLYCWGRAASNALGDPAVVAVDACIGATSTPVLASTLTGWSKLTASINQLCGLHDGQLWCWGTTTSGIGNGIWGSTGWLQLGEGVTDVSVGWNPFIDDTGAETTDLDLTCYVAGGAINCWGDNRYGQLAQGAATMAPTPVEIAGNHVWSSLQTGDSHTCGIDNGVAYCWGTNRVGTLDGKPAGGDPTTACTKPDRLCATGTPMVMPYTSHADAIRLGDDHTCVLDGTTLTCWGNNAHLQLGSATATSPSIVLGAWTGLFNAAAKGQCADQAGQTFCWGSVIGYRKPIAADARLDGMRYLGATAQIGDTTGAGSPRAHGCILDATNHMACFGVDLQGQFGRGTPAAPVCGNLVCELGESEALCSTDCNGKRTCTTNSCGALICSPPCGDGACNYAYNETCSTCAADCGACPYVALGRQYDALSVGMDSSYGYTCGIRTDKKIECWGRNNAGQAGAVDATAKPIDPVYTPTTIANLTDCTEVSTGSSTSCAICGGDIYCWGNHRTGAVGAGELTAFPITTPRKVEVELESGDRWAEIHSATGYTCARTELGHGYCWGFHARGALGTGATSMSVPVPIQIVP